MAKWIYPDPAVTYGIRDKQQDEPLCYCESCLRELYDDFDIEMYDGISLCHDCYEEAISTNENV